MKIDNVLVENLFEGDDRVIVQEAFDFMEKFEVISKMVKQLREADLNDPKVIKTITEAETLVKKINESFNDESVLVISEAVQRQFRRYGDSFKRQYRCTTGDKAGRLVTSPEKCGIRKDPKRVRMGKRAARAKKGQRIRKSLFTKRKTQSKRLSRLNKVLRGDK
jgi:hypothetical protein